MDNIETLIKTKEKKARVATPTTTATATATATESTSGNSCITIPPMGRGRTLEETAIYLKIAAIQRKENDEKVVAIALAKRAAFVMRESIMRETLTKTKNPTTTKIKKVKVSTKSPPASTIAFKVPPNNSCITLPSMRRIRTLQETLLHQKLAAIQQRKMNDDKVVAMALAKRAATSMDNIETLIKTKEKKARIDTDVTATATIVEIVPSNNGIILPPLRRGTTVKETTIYQKLAIIQQCKFNDEKVVAMALAKRAATSIARTKTLSTTKAKKARVA